MRRLFTLSLLTLAVACGGSTTDTPANPTGDTGAATGTGTPDGAELYASKCTSCHMADGSGGPASNDKDMADLVPPLSHQQIVDQIVNGGKGMPAISVSADEADALATYCEEQWGSTM